MMRPMPFCPSLLPWKKLTAVHVPISSARIPGGGGVWPSGSAYSLGFRMTRFISHSSASAPAKPISGLKNSPLKTLSACDQSTPDVPPVFAAISWLAKPTPSTEPISAWLDELGSPTYQVPRFHSTAANSSAKIIAKPALLPTCRIRSTGSSVTIV